MKRFWLPLAGFLALVAVLGVGLRLDPREVPSPLIDRPAPDFSLPVVQDRRRVFSREEMAGQVWVLNVWASWCGACRQEHALLMRMARSGEVPLYGLDYKDEQEEARAWLRRWGDPYRLTAMDESGRVGLEYGVYGVPETYVIDREGIIRYKQIGPLDEAVLRETVLPLVRELQRR